jgi:hypothetical protein
MNHWYCILLLVCTGASIIAEVMSILFPDYLIGLVRENPALVRLHAFHYVLGILSLFYMVAIALLVFSSDRIFRIYGFVFIILSVTLTIYVRRRKALHYIVMAESALCLIMLIDVFRAVVTCYW